MNTKRSLAAVTAAVLLLASLVGCATGSGVPATAPGQVIDLSPAQVQRLLGAEPGAVVLDVREPDEFAGGHLPGARLIPLGSLAQRLIELERGRPVVVVCRSGNRSAQGAAILAAAGFARVYNMAGGMLAWPGPVAK